ncbi:armadillo repeat-containing protein 3-like [Olea europaea var. sylvestris]|uniref:armadillo repeat-containing protein 3-like n=1 Tax=Olea europaea var. sylvestris TaxID=158386 RepID=UPI000C1D75BB|nr:armadillo repeat-containing protein 3-like [Olea europaea var. sylvestris]
MNFNMAEEESSVNTGKPGLKQAIENISSLISLSYSIKVFAVKWKSIRPKLEELLTNLIAIENCDFGENFSLSSTLEKILTTLKDCDELARRCIDLSYSGKLLMKSDLDIVSSKLDSHIKRLSGIYALGLLSNGSAILASRPSISASWNDMRFYVNDLLSRLKIGSVDMKKQALVAFNEAIQEDDRYIKIAVQIDSFINYLVNFLDFQDNEVQEEAAKAVSFISGFQSFRGVLVRVGIISPLIRVLECGSDLSKEFAAVCLNKFTENSENAWSVSSHGGVSILLKICNNGDNAVELVSLACKVLKNLVGVEEIKRFIIEEGAIPLFVKLARSKDEIIQISSLDFLQAMAYGDESIREVIVKEGGICALVRVLDPKSSFSSKTREVGFRGIVNLCFSSYDSLNMLINYGFMDHILYFLRYGDVSVQELALKAAFWLCATSEEAKKVMGDAGFMPALVKLLDSKPFKIREMAAETLSSMVIVPRNRKIFVQNDQNVGLLMQMLDPEKVNSGNKKLLISILMSLTSCNSARKKIMNSGHLRNIEKLAEAEVSDAKMIIRRLSSSKFQNIISGIWHS